MNIKVYNELNKRLYPIDSIKCHYLGMFVKLIITFSTVEDLEEFKKLVYKQLNLNILTGLEIYNKHDIESILLISGEYINNFNILHKKLFFKFPSDDLIKFPDNTLKFILENNINCFPQFMNNLPKKIKSLRIWSIVSGDFSNLPTELIELDINQYKCNLDYLPEGLKILKIYQTDGTICNSHYISDDFGNLPIGLEYICINNKIFKSTKELIEKYNSIKWIS